MMSRCHGSRIAVLPYSRAGISGAAMLGLGRAIGETIAATLVIGDQMVHTDSVDFNLLEPAALAVGLTLAVPALATVIVTALGDPWIGNGATVWQALPPAVAWTVRASITAGVALATVGLVADLRLIL